jgi:DNA-binding Lrp family transcriptional regulator
VVVKSDSVPEMYAAALAGRGTAERTAVGDELDWRLLHALGLDPRAPFSRIGAVLGVSDRTVARRFRRLAEATGLRVVGMRDPVRLGRPQWTLRLRCAPEASHAIATALARRPDTVWIGLASGGTEVIVHAQPRTRGDEQDLLLGKLPRTPQITGIRAQQALHRFYGGPDCWLAKSGALSPEEEAVLAPPARPAFDGTVLTLAPEDEPLVRAVERDGRVTCAQLAQATGRTESAVKRRLDALFASGAVYTDIEVDGTAYGIHASFLLSVTAEPGALDRVGRALAGHPEIAYAVAVTGDANLLAVAVTPDATHFYRYLSTRLGALDGVRHVETVPYINRVKALTYPMPWG